MGARWRKWDCLLGTDLETNSPYVKTIHTNKQRGEHILRLKQASRPQLRLTEVAMRQSLRDQTQTDIPEKPHLLFLGAVCKRKRAERARQ